MEIKSNVNVENKLKQMQEAYKLSGRKFGGKWYVTEKQLREYFEAPENVVQK